MLRQGVKLYFKVVLSFIFLLFVISQVRKWTTLPPTQSQTLTGVPTPALTPQIPGAVIQALPPLMAARKRGSTKRKTKKRAKRLQRCQRTKDFEVK